MKYSAGDYIKDISRGERIYKIMATTSSLQGYTTFNNIYIFRDVKDKTYEEYHLIDFVDGNTFITKIKEEDAFLEML